jgi:hypothetical protein
MNGLPDEHPVERIAMLRDSGKLIEQRGCLSPQGMKGEFVFRSERESSSNFMTRGIPPPQSPNPC